MSKENPIPTVKEKLIGSVYRNFRLGKEFAYNSQLKTKVRSIGAHRFLYFNDEEMNGKGWLFPNLGSFLAEGFGNKIKKTLAVAMIDYNQEPVRGKVLYDGLTTAIVSMGQKGFRRFYIKVPPEENFAETQKVTLQLQVLFYGKDDLLITLYSGRKDDPFYRKCLYAALFMLKFSFESEAISSSAFSLMPPGEYM